MRLFPLLLVACATTTLPPPSRPQGGPRGLHADEHRALAREHADLAHREESFPAATPMVPGDPTTGPHVMPWYRSWDPSADHARLAAIHDGEAAAIETAYAAACGTRDLQKVSVSPTKLHRIGGWNTSTGVVVYLDARAGNAEALMADLRCHQAWMMLANTGTMDDCPLDLPGLLIDARGDGQTITLVMSMTNQRLVPELQRRVAKEAEQH